METHNELDRFLSEQYHRSFSPAPGILGNKARAVIARRKRAEPQDVFSVVAGFLNYRVRLYHAILVVAACSSVLLYFSLKKEKQESSPASFQYVSNIAAVHNSTILPSINTFILRK
jgi:hypothetical protein